MNRKGNSAGVIGMVVVIAAIIGGLIFAGNAIPHILKIILIVAAAIIAILVVLVVVGIIIALRNSSQDPKKVAAQKNANQLSDDQAKILAKGRENLMNLRRLVMRISTKSVHSRATDVCNQIDKILQTLKQTPEKIASVRQFFNYYIPTLGEVLEKYDRIEDSKVPNEDMTRKVESYLDDVKAAMDKQYQNLFKDDMLDMSVEMEAMTMAVKRDGLISDEKVEVKDGEKKIELTL